jgi:hypothetical protein
MSAVVTITGAVIKHLGERVSRRGSPFAATVLRVPQDRSTLTWKVLAFGDLKPPLEALREEDIVSLSGPMRADMYVTPDGEHRLSLQVYAERIERLAAHSLTPPHNLSPHSIRRAPTLALRIETS